jgi:hypothetical protein
MAWSQNGPTGKLTANVGGETSKAGNNSKGTSLTR